MLSPVSIGEVSPTVVLVDAAHLKSDKWGLEGAEHARSLYPETLNRLFASENLDGEFRVVLHEQRTSVTESAMMRCSRSATG